MQDLDTLTAFKRHLELEAPTLPGWKVRGNQAMLNLIEQGYVEVTRYYGEFKLNLTAAGRLLAESGKKQHG